MRRALWWLCVVGLLGGSGCAPERSVDEVGAQPAAGPLLGRADSGDASDRQCQVVLRSVNRLPEDGGFQTNGRGQWVWEAQVDVARNLLVRGGVEVGVLYRSTADNLSTWWRVTGEPVAGGEGQFQRYRVRIKEGGFGPGLSGTALSRSVLELIPLVDQRGARLFDHNRMPGDLENYRLTLDNQWSVGEAPGVCPGVTLPPGAGGDPAPESPVLPVGAATVRFGADGGMTQEGALVPGGALSVEYALERLEGCRSTHNGFPAWDTRAYVKFLPSGQVQEQTVRRFGNVNGRPTNDVEAIPASFTIPAGATGAQVWFLHESAAQGTLCQRWDSNQDRNYALEVLASPGWIGAPVVKISRAGGHPCEGGEAMTQGFNYGTWARQRATTAHACVEVWAEGLTDREVPELWRRLDARAVYRYDEGEFQVAPLSLVDRVGNNARYSLDLRAMDPLASYRCPEAALEETEREVLARAELYFVVNGVVLEAEGGGAFEGIFADYPDNAWRDANCQ